MKEDKQEKALTERQEILLMKFSDQEASNSEIEVARKLSQDDPQAKKFLEELKELDLFSEASQSSQKFLESINLESRVMARVEQELQLKRFYNSRSLEEKPALLESLRNFLSTGWGQSLSEWGQGLFSARGMSVLAAGCVMVFGLQFMQSTPSGTSMSGNSDDFQAVLARSLSEREVSQDGQQVARRIVPVVQSFSDNGLMEAAGMSFAPKFSSDSLLNSPARTTVVSSSQDLLSERVSDFSAQGKSNWSPREQDDPYGVELEWVRSDGRVQVLPEIRSGAPILWVRKNKAPALAPVKSLSESSFVLQKGQKDSSSVTRPLADANINEAAKFSSEGAANIQ